MAVAKWTGILKGITEDAVKLLVDDTEVEIPYQAIKKAHVIATIDFNA